MRLLLVRARIALYIVAFAFAFIHAEPSVFAPPKNSQDDTLKNVQKQVFELSVTLKKVKETQDGMQSLFDAQNKKIQDIYIKNQQSPFVTQEYMEQNFKDLNKTLITNFRTYDENLENLKQGLESLGKLIETLNQSYKNDIGILSERLDALKQEQEEIGMKFENKQTKEEDKSIKSLSGADAHNGGLSFFKKGELDKAKQYFEQAVQNNYKPATSIYYLGEIAYRQKRYNDAIMLYKDSATRYDKASYIPNLLLHTAFSFQQLDDTDNAKNFLRTLVDSYPEAKEAKEAKEALVKLK